MINIKNLTLLRDGMIKQFGDAVFDERFYMFECAIDSFGLVVDIEDVDDCGYRMDLIGWSLKLGIQAGEEDGYMTYAKSALSSNITVLKFLASPDWSSDIQQAIKRLTYVIDNGKAPDDWHRDYGYRL